MHNFALSMKSRSALIHPRTCLVNPGSTQSLEQANNLASMSKRVSSGTVSDAAGTNLS